MNDYQIFKNIDGHKGTCFMELLPGPFNGKAWNAESIFFDDDSRGFGIVETVIAAHVPSYDHYANTTIDGRTCWDIVRDLEMLIGILRSDTSPSDLRGLPVFQHHQEFFAEVENNRPALLAMLTELVAWLRATLESYGSVTIIGM